MDQPNAFVTPNSIKPLNAPTTREAGCDLPRMMTEIAITTPGGPEVLQARPVALPMPAAGEVLIRVAAAGVNRPDVIQRAGLYPLPPGANATPGLEVAGEIVALGAGVRGFELGQRVCALTNGGGYAEYCVAPSTQVLPIPAGLSDVQAAAIPESFFTVWANLFELGGALPGDSVLIHGGTSGIGTTALMFAKEFGLKAYATAGSGAKCEVIRELGGDAINYRETDFAEEIQRRTAGRGVDVVLDIVGAPYFERNVDVLATGGTLLLVGFLGGATVSNVNLMSLSRKRAWVTGSLMRPRSDAEKSALATQLHERVWPALAAGRCQPLIDRVFPLTEAAAAHAYMESGEHVGKIVLIARE